MNLNHKIETGSEVVHWISLLSVVATFVVPFALLVLFSAQSVGVIFAIASVVILVVIFWIFYSIQTKELRTRLTSRIAFIFMIVVTIIAFSLLLLRRG
jgi:hypothetical protein